MKITKKICEYCMYHQVGKGLSNGKCTNPISKFYNKLRQNYQTACKYIFPTE